MTNRLTRRPRGRLMLTVLGGLAEFERELITTRTSEGRARAKALGPPIGRRPKLTSQQQAQDLDDLRKGRVTQADLARRHNVTRSTITRMVAKAEIGLPVAPRMLDAETVKARCSFLRNLKGRYAPLKAVVYGSRARGTHSVESDADMAVILKGSAATGRRRLWIRPKSRSR